MMILHPIYLKSHILEGLLSGNITIENPFAKPLIDYDLAVEKFKLEHDSVGVIKANGNYSTSSGIVKFNAVSDNDAYNFNVDGAYNTKDSTGKQLDISFNTQKLDLSILNNYLDGIFSKIKGNANTSNLKITGNAKHLNLLGDATINDASLIVNFTQCKYKIQNQKITFKPEEIDFGDMVLKDTLNNPAHLKGKIYHNFFQNFEFDNLSITSPKLLVLNTTKKDNNQFYGKVIADAEMQLDGPAEDMQMKINGKLSNTDSSHIYLLSGGSSSESGSVDYINFIQFGSEMESNLKLKSSSSILVDMNVEANPACKIDVILDEATGDIIKGTGNGNLNIRVGNKEPLSIRGKYDITKGDYTFNYQSIIKKPFTLSNGSIIWSGDPLNASIDMSANYLAKSVDFSGLSNSDSRRNSNVSVVAHLTETLLHPKINFELLPENADLQNDILISKRLQELKTDENEMNKQITSLLLFNSFINDNQQFFNTNSGINVATNTIGGMITGVLSSSINKLFQLLKIDNTVAFNADVSSKIDLQNSISKIQGAAKFDIVLNFFSNRLIINIGGNFDYNNPYVPIDNRNKITPDLTVQWLLNQDGRLRLVGFNQTNTDIIGQRNKTGVKLTYRREVDNFSDLFKK